MSWPEPAGSILAELEARVRDLLGANLSGMYVYGSLAFGCYNPQLSDVDVLVLTRRPIAPETRSPLAEMLRAIAPSTRLEISFLARPHIEPWRHPCPCEFHFSRSAEVWHAPNYDMAAEITNARTRAVALLGPPAQEALPDVPELDFEEAILGDARWAQQHLAERPGYVVLNGCRILAYRQERRVISKAEAGEWGARSLPERFRGLARAAAARYAGTTDQELDHEQVAVFADWLAAKLALD